MPPLERAAGQDSSSQDPQSTTEQRQMPESSNHMDVWKGFEGCLPICSDSRCAQVERPSDSTNSMSTAGTETVAC